MLRNKNTMNNIYLKRVYEPISEDDGYRVLVDRLWPRGEKKEDLEYNIWAKDIAPSTDLREWFHEDEIGRWNSFKNKYMLELENSTAAKELKNELKKHSIVTLLYLSKHNDMINAIVVKEFLVK